MLCAHFTGEAEVALTDDQTSKAAVNSLQALGHCSRQPNCCLCNVTPHTLWDEEGHLEPQIPTKTHTHSSSVYNCLVEGRSSAVVITFVVEVKVVCWPTVVTKPR